MGKINTKSIVLYGKIDTSPTAWLRWYEYSLSFCKEFDIESNYVGITGDSFKSGKIMHRKRVDSRIKKSLINGESISAMTIYSLPESFKQAAFDYHVYLGREAIGKTEHIILTISDDVQLFSTIEKIVDNLKQHIEFESGQVFEMLNSESPQFYAARINPVSVYRSLKVISDF